MTPPKRMVAAAGFEQGRAGHVSASAEPTAGGGRRRLRRARLERRAASSAARSTGTTPCGTSSTKPTRIDAEQQIGIEQSAAPPMRLIRYWIGERAEDRSEQRAEAAEQDEDDDLGGVARPNTGRADEAAPVGVEAAGEPGDAAADHEGEQLVKPRVVAEQHRAGLVLADRHDDAAEAAGAGWRAGST